MITAFVLAFAPVFGAAASLDDIQAAAENIRSVKARFIQEKHMKILVKPLVSAGIILYQAPGSLRFEYQTPIKNILLMQGETVTRYIQKGDALVRDKTASMGSMAVVMDEISRWIKGDFDTKAFDVSLMDLPGPDRIRLIPKEKAMARFIQEIEIGLSEHPGVFKEVTIRENADSFTRLLFEDVVVNSPIDPGLFEVFK